MGRHHDMLRWWRFNPLEQSELQGTSTLLAHVEHNIETMPHCLDLGDQRREVSTDFARRP
jgi:hypothetical protein